MEQFNQGDAMELQLAKGLLREALMNASKKATDLSAPLTKAHMESIVTKTFRSKMKLIVKLEERAKEDRRSLSYMVNMAICQFLKVDPDEYL